MRAAYVIWSNEHAAWWGPHERGYTTILEEAGRYDLAHARRIVDKATVGGLLPKVTRQSRLSYGAVDTVNEVLLLAPESVELMLTYVADQLAGAGQVVELADAGPGHSIIVNSDQAEPTVAGPAFDAEALHTLHESMSAAGLRIVAGPGPLREVLPEAMGLLAEPTTAEVVAEKRQADQ